MKMKRFLAGFIAVAMTVAMIPTLVFADEAESGTKEPAAVEETEAKEEEKKPAAKETKPAEEEKKEPEKKAEPEEKPSETEDKKAEEPKTEEPAETEDKKAEEPAESEDKKAEEPKAEEPSEPEDKKDEQPAEKPDTVTGKNPVDSDSSAPKKAPITVKTISNIVLNDSGSLTWDAVDGAVEYLVTINNIEEYVYTNRLDNVYSLINNGISNGRLKIPAGYKFKFTVYALGETALLGKGVKELTLSGSVITATEPSVGSIPNAKIKDGRLYWKNITNAYVYEYDLYINGFWVKFYTSCGKKGVSLRPLINQGIKEGAIDKAKNNKYSILLLASDGADTVGRYSATFTYKTSAKRLQHYTFDSVTQSKAKLTWSSIKGAKYYKVIINDPRGGYNNIERKITSTSADINNIVANYMNFEGAPSGFLIAVAAYNSSGDAIAIWSGYFIFNVEPNPLSVSGKTAKVKYSKLKKKKQTLAASKVINGTGTGRGPMTYTKVSGHKNISINKKTGKVTIKKKGLKKGKTYSVSVVISAAGNGGYEPSTEQTVTFKIKVTK